MNRANLASALARVASVIHAHFFQMVVKHGFEILHQIVHARPGLGREIFLHIKLAQRLANAAVNDVRGAFPARFLLRLAAQDLAEKVEIFLLERRRQRRARCRAANASADKPSSPPAAAAATNLFTASKNSGWPTIS